MSSIGHGHYADLMEAAVVKDDSHGWEFTWKYQDSVVIGDLRSLNIDIYDVFLSGRWRDLFSLCFLWVWHFLEHVLREGNGNPLQYSCLENPMDGGAWWAAVHGVVKSQTRLSDFIFTFNFHALEKEMIPTPVFLPGESQGRGSLVGCRLWGLTESNTTELTWQQQQQSMCFLSLKREIREWKFLIFKLATSLVRPYFVSYSTFILLEMSFTDLSCCSFKGLGKHSSLLNVSFPVLHM